MPPKLGLLGEASALCVQVHIPERILTAVEVVSHKGVNNSQDVPSECHHISTCDSKRGGDGQPARKK